MSHMQLTVPDAVNLDDLSDALESRGYAEHVHFEIEFAAPDTPPTLIYYSEEFRQIVLDTITDLQTPQQD